MRIWSLHPQYLDAKGLVALWRETLLAKNVLLEQTKGYKNHPQLNRFKQTAEPVQAINKYLAFVYEEALKRGYHFNAEKFDLNAKAHLIPVTKGQIAYEAKHLLKKLKERDAERYAGFKNIKIVAPHPLFYIVDGGVEDWEVL